MRKQEYRVGDKIFMLDDYIDPSLMERVMLDVGQGIPSDQSVIKYTPGMKAYREYFEAWVKNLPPGHIVDFPTLS